MPDLSTPRPRPRRLVRPALAVGALLALASCAGDAPYDTLEPRGELARDIDGLYNAVLIVATIVFVIVMAAVVFIGLRYRRRGGGRDDFDHNEEDHDLPKQIHGNTRYEIGWTIAPAVILAVIAIPTVGVIWSLAAAAEDDDALTIQVYGQQWWWEFRYPENGDIVTANTIVFPAGENIQLEMTSRDVIHSFWIPALNGKRDVVPGRIHLWAIEADEPGVYWGQCVEFCGLSHANMRIRGVALGPDDWERWVETHQLPADVPGEDADGNVVLVDQPRADEPGNIGDAANGYTLFGTFCSSCHVIDGVYEAALGPNEIDDPNQGEAPLTADWAPNLTHLMSRTGFAANIYDLYDPDGSVNIADLREWIHNAPALKPMAPDDDRGMISFEDTLTRTDLDDLVAYLLTLGDDPVLPPGADLTDIVRRTSPPTRSD